MDSDLSWSGATRALETSKTPAGYRIDLLARDEVPATIASLRRWYVDLEVSSERCHLHAEFYYDQAFLRGEDHHRPVLVVVAKHADELVAVLTLEKDVDARSVSCRVGAIAPEHRGPALALLGPMLLESIGRAVGAELVLYFATMKSAHQQVLAERARYQLVGIVPAVDRNFAPDLTVKRVYEALYAKVLVARDDVVKPPTEAMTARTLAVWRALFGGA